MEILELEGDYFEGGGQILRTSLTLSAILKKPFKITKIRANRKNPGLAPQHLTCVKAMEKITGGKSIGNTLGSTELEFSPGEIRGGNYSFDVSETKGSAGSISLLAQTIILPLAFAKEESSVQLKGGTHVSWSPIVDYISNVFVPLLEKMGANCEITLRKAGFYPLGGGEIELKIRPVKELTAINIETRGELKEITGVSAVSKLTMAIAKRQKLEMLRAIASDKGVKIQPKLEEKEMQADCPGTFCFICAKYENTIAGFSSLGEVSKKAEQVGREAAEHFIKFNNSNNSLDEHLQDQILIPAALSNGETAFQTEKLSSHAKTNIYVIKKFIPELEIDEREEKLAGTEKTIIKVKIKGANIRGSLAESN